MSHTCRGRATLWLTGKKAQMNTVMCTIHRVQSRATAERGAEGEVTKRRRGVEGMDIKKDKGGEIAFCATATHCMLTQF